jgi:hypothetical protein
MALAEDAEQIVVVADAVPLEGVEEEDKQNL